ncbi:hypothetical protein M527_07200 [Sphingobium indicum IP26]|uniref:Uncharacterized protein n=1 Tax=Sphingobium indicum F2 TaxID=1450518 RepID=A0A8E1C343_9SPHN|nr:MULTISPECIES: hypothetical protein [Sphingobium]EPR09903.1 hypothetical protein M527_07200 [Sphingobium indicum IP26]EQB05031.1 hypothetical protein L286_09715 [Sphingobium sp. HDIP04]KER36696.1 hypothetical protein AL00_09495 [Sphingobium indicum F2]
MSEATAYRPSCGSEGADFMARWCGRCTRDIEGYCRISADTMVFRVTDFEYPVEWRTDSVHGPRCTAFDAIDPMDQPFDPGAAIGLLL